MKTRTKKQNQQLFAVLKRTGLTNQRASLALSFSDLRTEHTSELTPKECRELINYLNTKYPDTTRAKPSGAAQKMRRKIFSICHELGWEDNEGEVVREHLEAFLKKYGYLHKPLNDYTDKELPRLVTQFENMLAKHYAKISSIENKDKAE